MIPPRPPVTAVLNSQLQRRITAFWKCQGSYQPFTHRRVLRDPFLTTHGVGIHSTQSRRLSSRSKSDTATQPILTITPITENVINITKATKSRSRTKLEWNPEADAELLELRSVHNKTWLEIGQQLGRVPATCMSRYESTVNPALDGFWTWERDQKLDELVTSSKTWADIAKVLGVHRLACMERWRQLELEGLSSQSPTDQSLPVESRQEPRARKSSKPRDQQQQQQYQGQRPQTVQETRETVKDIMSRMNLDLVNQIDKDNDRSSWNDCVKDEQRYSHYQARKKKARLDAFSQLYLMNPGWSAKEETILIQFVLKHGLDKWHIVAKEGLNGRFTAAQCITCWKNLDMPVVAPQSSSDKQQQESLLSFDDDIEPSSGTRSSGGQGDSNQPETAFLFQESGWQRERVVLFWHLWGQHGDDWKTISKTIGTTKPACRIYLEKVTRRICKDYYDTENVSEVDQLKIQGKILTLAQMITKDFNPQFLSAKGANGDNDTSRDSDIAVGTGSSRSTPTTPSETSSSRSSRAPTFIWDKRLSVRLQAVVRQAYKSRVVHLDEINWLWVSSRVHPDATSRICKNHWQFLYDTTSAVWTQEDIRKLEEGVRLLGPKGLTAIREHFLPHMTKDDITRQWYRISDKAATIDEEEYYQLLNAVKKTAVSVNRTTPPSTNDTLHLDAQMDTPKTSVLQPREINDPQMERWIEVEKRMGLGWKRLPCKRVWESSFQHLIRVTQWTSDEDTALLRLVKFVGRDDWYSVARAMPSGRSAWQYRLRWCQLLDPVDLNTSNLTVNGEKYC
ncbi:hypothetical protein B0O80DRAFT_449437 [Mortierella sp. GBAus27b]|nr:hypothetical protein BGX31_010447 [Mortierella sp. GBA43]KAI8355507.1 hypothetical protein B0O80DRAFT_449437 [Mortierella sp. GBAus27b]